MANSWRQDYWRTTKTEFWTVLGWLVVVCCRICKVVVGGGGCNDACERPSAELRVRRGGGPASPTWWLRMRSTVKRTPHLRDFDVARLKAGDQLMKRRASKDLWRVKAIARDKFCVTRATQAKPLWSHGKQRLTTSGCVMLGYLQPNWDGLASLGRPQTTTNQIRGPLERFSTKCRRTANAQKRVRCRDRSSW